MALGDHKGDKRGSCTVVLTLTWEQQKALPVLVSAYRRELPEHMRKIMDDVIKQIPKAATDGP